MTFVVRHGYVLVFLWVLVEQGGIPIPSVPLMLACGALARNGRLSAHLILLAGIAGCFTADNIWYWLGRYRGSKVLRLICRVSLEPDSCVRQTETAFLRYGSRSLLITKFIPALSVVASPLAAMSGMRFTRFAFYDITGALVWLGSYFTLGYVFSNQLDRLGDYFERMGSWLALFLGGALALWVGWKFFQRQRFLKKLAVARITTEELRAKLDAGEDIVVVDVRSLLESEYDSVPGALRIPLEDMDTRHGDIPRDRDIILFCS